jgi:polyisoprenoid-binding protein YceI
MAQPGVSGAQYVMEPKLSQFTVQAFASGLISAAAHSPKIAIRDWRGETGFVPNSIKEAYLSLKAKTSSLEVIDELRDADRKQLHNVMHHEVLETTRFPEFTFESSVIDAEREKQDIYRLNVTGGLTLHGVTNPHSFVAQVAFGVDSYRAYGSFTILQSDYGLKIASIAGGTLKLLDELKCSFYVVAKKRQPTA